VWPDKLHNNPEVLSNTAALINYFLTKHHLHINPRSSNVGSTNDCPDSNYVCFHLKSLLYARVIITTAQVATPQACTIQLTGLKYDSTTVIGTLIFNPVLGVDQFAPKSLPTFTCLKRVNLQLQQPTTGSISGITYLDNVAYDANPKYV
jgi:hypothetical protein